MFQSFKTHALFLSGQKKKKAKEKIEHACIVIVRIIHPIDCQLFTSYSVYLFSSAKYFNEHCVVCVDYMSFVVSNYLLEVHIVLVIVEIILILLSSSHHVIIVHFQD